MSRRGQKEEDWEEEDDWEEDWEEEDDEEEW